MELDVIRRVLEEIKFKVERDINLTQLDQENYIVIVEALEKQIPLLNKCELCDDNLENGYYYCSMCGQRLRG